MQDVTHFCGLKGVWKTLLDSLFMCVAVAFCTRKKSFITILNVPHRLGCRHLSHVRDRRGEAKNSEAAKPGTLLHAESASCWRGRSPRRVRQSHQGFIYRVLFSDFNPTTRGFAAAADAIVVIVSAKNPYLRKKVLAVRSYCVLPTDCLIWVTSSTCTGRRLLQSRAGWQNEKGGKKNTDEQKRNPTYYPFQITKATSGHKVESLLALKICLLSFFEPIPHLRLGKQIVRLFLFALIFSSAFFQTAGIIFGVRCSPKSLMCHSTLLWVLDYRVCIMQQRWRPQPQR